MVTCLLLARILRALPSPSLSSAFGPLQGGYAVFSHKWVEGLVTKPEEMDIFTGISDKKPDRLAFWM